MYLIILSVLVTCFGIQMLSPYSTVLDDGVVVMVQGYPNVPIVLEFSPKLEDREYDVYEIDLPSGWNTNPIARFQNPIRIIITPSDRSAGLYVIPIKFIDEQNINPLPAKTIILYVNVSRDMFTVSTDRRVQGNYRQPVRFKVSVDTAVPFTYIIEARSHNNRFLKEVYIRDRYEQTIEFIYPFEGEFDIDIEVRPKYSNTMKYRQKITAIIKEDIFMDFQAYKYGALLYFQQNSVIASLLNILYQLLNR
ncbi:MAG: hypothetical protein NZ908_01515 [Candidatus Micrarchaeota archaeon]|nr:hypothetical protein [Candidatus Micrarchaeota archaeon]MCX8154376.1 hypothetical protein [Candidatus Micrarchaeota archaeon]